MKVTPLIIPGAYEISLDPLRDERGYFMRTYDADVFAEKGLQTDWVQENQSVNYRSGTIRGFHFH